MNKRITRIAPLKAGIVLAILYALIAVCLVPFFLIIGFGASAAAAQQAGSGIPFASMFGVGALFLPVMYGAFGFIAGVIAAALYNLVAKWTGGFELTVENLA